MGQSQYLKREWLKNFLDLMKEINPHIQEAQQILSRIKRDLTQTLQKTQEKEKMKSEKDDRSHHRKSNLTS